MFSFEYLNKLHPQEPDPLDTSLDSCPDYLKGDDVFIPAKSDSFIGNFIQDLMEHPEKSSIYRNEILFKQEGIVDSDYNPSKGWQINIPLINIQF